MVKLFGLTMLAIATASATPTILDSWRPLKASYTIFSGPTLADREAPTKTDRKLTILMSGQPAKEVFDSIGPDLPDTCSNEKGDRERTKQGVVCSYDASDGSPKGYRCWIGIDLRTGKGVHTVTC